MAESREKPGVGGLVGRPGEGPGEGEGQENPWWGMSSNESGALWRGCFWDGEGRFQAEDLGVVHRDAWSSPCESNCESYVPRSLSFCIELPSQEIVRDAGATSCLCLLSG